MEGTSASIMGILGASDSACESAALLGQRGGQIKVDCFC
jgi:hypothetical protein